MKRTNYFNHTRPTQDQLNNTESSKIDSLLRRERALGQMGILRGFRVRVDGADQTTIDVGPGEGYTGGKYQLIELIGTDSGERISTFSDAASGYSSGADTVSGQGLADYTSGAKNYVVLKYVEYTDIPLAERYYPFTVHQTRVNEYFTVEVYTETDWNNLSFADKDLRILIAIVTAQGAGNALSAANIEQFVQPKTHPTTTQPTVLTGVTVESLSQETPLGVGTIRFNATTKQLYWTAPGDAEGSGVIIPNAGLYTVYSDNVAYWINLSVVFSSLPSSDTTDTINVTPLYGRNIPMASAVDAAHRDMVGSGQPTVHNPHGMTLDDLPGGTFTHADLFHLNGISNDADIAQLSCSIDPVRDYIVINNIGGFGNSFLIDGNTYELIEGTTPGTNGIVAFDIIPLPTTGNYIIFLDDSANPQKVYIGAALWSMAIRIVDMRNTTSGTGTLTWDATDSTITWAAQGDVAGTPVEIFPPTFIAGSVFYYKIYSSNTANWIIIKISGAIGGSNSSTINIDMDSTRYPEDSMLRLCSVYWNSAIKTFAGLVDLRRFTTADNRPALEEEHSPAGLHTKVLRNTLEVAVDGDIGIAAIANTGTALYGSAANLGIVGIAGTASGIYGSAPTSAIVASANNEAIDALAANDTAIYALAGNKTAIYAKAAVALAGVFSAPTTALVATVAGDTAGLFYANSHAVHAEATNNIAVYGSAPARGGVFLADNYAGSFVAAVNTAIYASANIYAVYAVAAGFAIFGSVAANSAIVGSAVDVAIFGQAVNTAIRAIANVGTAFYGAASSVGAYFYASNTAAMGTCNADNATAVIGYAAGTGATGLYGEGAKGIGAVVSGSQYGLIVSNTMQYMVAKTLSGFALVSEWVPIVVTNNAGSTVLRWLQLCSNT